MAGRLRRVQQRDAGSYYREMQQRDAGNYYRAMHSIAAKAAMPHLPNVVIYIKRTRTCKTRARANM